MMGALRCFLLATLLVLAPASADTVRLAVASNFATTLNTLAARFERDSAHTLIISPGSTGKHYAQITHGAPFDLFLAADATHPRKLEEAGIGIAGSRFTYALGALALWSNASGMRLNEHSLRQLEGNQRLAIANPRLAPYGRAAQQVLQHLGLWQALRGKIVRGENVGQAFHYVSSGNAALGLIALSQTGQGGSRWIVPNHWYTPIEQQALLLSDRPGAIELAAFLRSDRARAIITRSGYRVAPP